jgi:hypothetical protein
VLVSETTRALLPSDLPGGAEIIDLGQHSLKDLERSERLFQLVAPGLRLDFPPQLPTQPAGTRKTSRDGSTSLSTAGSRPCSRGSTSRRWIRDAGCCGGVTIAPFERVVPCHSAATRTANKQEVAGSSWHSRKGLFPC